MGRGVEGVGFAFSGSVRRRWSGSVSGPCHGFRGFVRSPDEGDARGDEEDWDEGGEGESVSFWRH